MGPNTSSTSRRFSTLSVTEKLSEGYSLETALRQELTYWFGEELAAKARLKPVIEVLIKE